ncbi:MAG: ATP-dependent DNA helicase, partial [Rhodanobacter sp.]
ACLENIVGERQIPDHPLVAQTLHDCLREAMDMDGLLHLLHGLEDGSITVVARDLAAPSPFAAEVLNAAPYAFLDDAPLEERRTRIVRTRGSDIENADDLGRLDPDAIDAVRAEAWPEVRSADEMHEALNVLGFVTAAEAMANDGWNDKLHALAHDHRATRLSPSPLRGEGWGEGTLLPQSLSEHATSGVYASTRPSSALPGTFPPMGGRNGGMWVCAEKLPLWQAVHADATLQPAIAAPAEYAAQAWTRDEALRELVRGRLVGLGPVTVATLAQSLQVTTNDIETALLHLQSEGYVIQGRFTPTATDTEWCERHLLARIHRYTLGRLRREIEPVNRRDFMRFLLDWQHLTPATRLRGPDALDAVLAQLEGYEAAAGAWESELLPARIADYASSWLDNLCRAGRIGWTRLRAGSGGSGPVRATPIVLLSRRSMAIWTSISASDTPQESLLSSRAQAVADELRDHGALFFDELLQATRLLRTELEDALGELVAAGRINADSFAGLRALLLPAAKREAPRHRRVRRHQFGGIEDAGRWALVRRPLRPIEGKVAPKGVDAGRVLTEALPTARFDMDRGKSGPSPQPSPRRGEGEKQRMDDVALEHIARSLLARHGVMFWKLLEREAPWLPAWRELLRVYRRLEARGEIRGGRFVEGLVGEQFALPEAIPLLRDIRQREHDSTLACVCGSDPLNLVGTVLAGDKLPAVPGTRVLYEDGVAVAALVANKPQWLVDGDATQQQRWRQALLRRSDPVARN